MTKQELIKRRMAEAIQNAEKRARIAVAALRKIKRIRRPEDEEREIAEAALKRIAKLERAQ